MITGSGYDDGIEWRVLRPAEITVTDAGTDVVILQTGEHLLRALSQFRYDFDTVHLLDQLTEHRCLITRTGAQFKNHGIRLELEQVGHNSDDVRL